MSSTIVATILSLALCINLISCKANNEEDKTEVVNQQINESIEKLQSEIGEGGTYEVTEENREYFLPIEKVGNSKKGREIFINTCASCHGMEGAGDGIVSIGLEPKPRDLADKDYISLLSDSYLYTVISLGGKSVKKSALMPQWNEILSEDEIWDVISHIRINICKCSYQPETEISQ